MMKGQKGITLVALVITIIVMLILVAVSVSIAINTGLFTTAKNAGNNWKAEQTAEGSLGENIIVNNETTTIDAVVGNP